MKKRRRILATGGIATALLITGASQTYAQTIPVQRSSRNSEQSLPVPNDYDDSTRPDMEDFGIQADDVVSDTNLEESSRQILIEEGFSPAQIHKIVNSSSGKYKNSKYSEYDEE